MGKISILSAMIIHHALIEVYLAVLKDSQSQGAEASVVAFNNFRWQLEKHFFVEERAIFDQYKSDDAKVKQLVERVLLEHRQIIQMMDELKIKITDGESVDFSQLSETVVSHRELEDKELYPLIDIEFDDVRKKEITDKINDIILKSE